MIGRFIFGDMTSVPTTILVLFLFLLASSRRTSPPRSQCISVFSGKCCVYISTALYHALHHALSIEMGLPYSKQINAAFDQVTPLVAAGFEVLQTTKNIAVLLAVIEVITAITLILILLALLALLLSVNPDLSTEREQLVTPTMKWLASWVVKYGRVAGYVVRFALVIGSVVLGWSVWQGLTTGHDEPKSGDGEEQEGASDDKKDDDASRDEKDAKEEN